MEIQGKQYSDNTCSQKWFVYILTQQQSSYIRNNLTKYVFNTSLSNKVVAQENKINSWFHYKNPTAM